MASFQPNTGSSRQRSAALRVAAEPNVGRLTQLSPSDTEILMSRKTAQSANVYIALPPSGKGTGVLVIHAWWGLNNFFKGVCDRLAKEGFVAVAPDLFEDQVATTIAGAKRLRAKPKREPTYKTLIRAIEQLSNHPAVQGSTIGVVGFSMGGHWALWLSQRPELPIGATVTFYGARAGDYSSSRAAFLAGLYPVQAVRACNTRLKASDFASGPKV
jgi:dienelactone hydrolase